MKKIIMAASTFCFLFVVAACETNTSDSKDTAATSSAEQSEDTAAKDNRDEEAQDPEGTIVVESTEGILSGAEPSTRDFIQQIESGNVAYLGSKGATATYSVSAAAAGTYKLHIKTSDDGTWGNGFRDASIMVNEVNVLNYTHVSENTHGWKWLALGNVSLKEGENTIAFSKSNDMPAAFSFTQFKLVPVLVSQ
ncbi:MAG TPA: hypothetical protein PKL83_01230 [bacterium]|nr:hypothetical protein [bacterium]